MGKRTYKSVILEVENGIARLTLNRPDKLNAINNDMRKELVEAVREVSEDDDARVMIITGAGRGFCSGADVGGMHTWGDARRQRSLLAPYGIWADGLAKLEKPIIAAINGVAVGIGLSLALLSDIRIASERARFAAAWIRRGLVPDGGATYLLPKVVGVQSALELMYTGDIIDATKAKEIGLVGHVVPHEQLIEVTNGLAGRIAKGPPIALALTKRTVYRSTITDWRTQLDFESYAQNICHKTEDHKEGVAAFLEKREPQFKGA